jgi:hypothetical protein
MATSDQLENSWTVVLRRQPARIVEGQPEGGYSDMFELICCDCGDDPDLDYRDVSPRLQLVRGPYPIAVGVAAYQQHVESHQWSGCCGQGAVTGPLASPSNDQHPSSAADRFLRRPAARLDPI